MEEKNSNIIFNTISAYDGMYVQLTQEKFNEHIIKHHPEMKGHEKDIEETIKNPSMVCIAKTFPEKRRYFLRKTNKGEPSEYNNVIVECDDEENKKAHVTTSYYSKDIGKGGGECVYFKYDNKI